MRLNRRNFLYIVILLCAVISTSAFIYRCSGGATIGAGSSEDLLEEEEIHEYKYGICIDSLTLVDGEVGSGESFSTIVSKFGVSGLTVEKIAAISKDVFDLRGMRLGASYCMITTSDSIATPLYFVYEHNIREYVVYSLQDSLYVHKETKPITSERRRLEASISSSLWNAIVDKGVSIELSEKMENVFQWSVDFYGIQSGDSFNVIYDEEFIDGKSVGIGTIYGAWFDTSGKRVMAIRHEYDDKVGYWDENGKSAKKAFLKAPLNFSRISSKFSPSRMHPVLRIRRPHYGVDYAAPTGTPVRAIADGTVTFRAYSGGGGNTIKIKHSQGYISGYLHLNGYAKGLTVGKRVAQGEVIGYVGSTGLSTGPHLDFRIWKNGTPIDPLKLGQEPGVPIPDSQLPAFKLVRDRIVSELEGGPYIPPVADSLTVVQADSIDIKEK